jgi:hypothetical protein
MLGVSKGAQQMVDGVADTVQVQMTRAGWLQWCAQQPK